MKKLANQLVAVLFIVTLLTGSIGMSSVHATGDLSENELENSVHNIINTIEKNVVISEEGVFIKNKGQIIKNLRQEDIENFKILSKNQGIKYDKPINKNTVLEMFGEGIELSDKAIKSGELTVLKNGSFIETEDDDFYLQGGSTYDKSYWWGKERYKSTYNAGRWTRDLRSAGHLNAGMAVIAGAIFGGVGAIPNGLSSIYVYNLADKVDYRNSLNNRGIIAKLTYTLVFTTASQ
ncbi:MAG TPA: hypothetical protein ENN12_03220 [Epsilonproteobacteria bacterium]|nr:hypothetical protein [Campylobacterota bacterium]